MLTYVKATSANKKTGNLAVVYRSIGSCPEKCFHHPSQGGTCYGLAGPGGGAFHIPNKYGQEDADGLHSLRQLAYTLPYQWWLRLGVVGDFLKEDQTPDREYIKACNDLAEARPDIGILAYTHAWNGYGLKPSDFVFTVNASCETDAEVELAQSMGWTAVLTLEPENDPLIGQVIGGKRVIVCPNEVDERVKCKACKLCSKADRPTIVGFPAHGTFKNKAGRNLLEKRS